MKSKLKKYFQTSCFEQKEPGDGGISYAMYFIAIIICVLLFVFLQFNAGMYVAEEVLENGLHIVENKIMTENQSEFDDSGSRVDNFNKEIKRLHIVTSYDSSQGSLTTEEASQLNAIGNEFSSALQKQLNLNGTKPVTGILLELSSPDSDILISGPVVIYEPVYKRTVAADPNGSIAGTRLSKFNFVSTYEIIGWIKYDLYYSNNVYTGASKQIVDVANTPKLKNGDLVEGATIEASIAITFEGIKNIFASVEESEKFFKEVPETNKYGVVVTQSTDIVISSLDSRGKDI